MCDAAGSTGLPFSGFIFVGRWIDGLDLVRGFCRDAGRSLSQSLYQMERCLTFNRIVEYATREQAQQAIQTLSNQSLMGRLVYVREVCEAFRCAKSIRMSLTASSATRIAKQSLVSLALRRAATTVAHPEVGVLAEAMVAATTVGVWLLAVAAVADNSTSPMFVLRAMSPPLIEVC